ncbi:MAG: hypothetical protein GC164_15015 [Phycisphaera sp.]|nr:hypothetical protein [Phycisphaera sp.]
MTRVNLIPEHLIESRRARRTRARWIAALVVLVCVLSLGVGWTRQVRLRVIEKDQRLRAQLAQIESSSDRLAARTVTLKKSKEQAQRTLDAYQIVDRRNDWAPLLPVLAGATNGTVVLRTCALGPASAGGEPLNASTGELGLAGYELRISALTTDPAEAAKFVLRLEQTKVFDSVSLTRSSKQTVGGHSVLGFEVACTITRGRGAKR